jgi:hypothetical protein
MGRPICIRFVAAVLVLISLVGCSGDDAPDGNTETATKTEKPVEGSFVGEVTGTNAFIAVVAASAEDEESGRNVQVYVADGRRVSEAFSGSISDNSFLAKSTGSDAEAEGELTGESVTGTIDVGNRKAARYNASQPAGAAGLYNLTMSPRGKLSGSSSAGLGVEGRVELVTRTGVLRLADGRRVKLDIAEDPASDLRLRAGQVRLIILPSGEVAGAGKSPLASEGGSSVFFIRSRS